MEFDVYLRLADEIISAADINAKIKEQISAGARAEYNSIPTASRAPQKDDNNVIYRVAKQIRLAGTWPYYTAQLMALHLCRRTDFLRKGASMVDWRAYVNQHTGFIHEVELVEMVAEACFSLGEGGYAVIAPEKAALMGETYAKGYAYERDFRGCAQCAFAAVSDVTGQDDPDIFRAANGFAAGMALMGDGVCGGYSGGLLSIGLYAGRRRAHFDGDKEEKDLNGEMARQLHRRYIDTYGSVICHDIHWDIFDRVFNLTLPEDKEAFEQAGAHNTDKCPAVVGTAAAWVCEILMDKHFL